MIVCSCAVVSDADLEAAIIAIMRRPDPPLPTPGVIFRELEKKMRCCGCAPLLVATIYERFEALEAAGKFHREATVLVRKRLARYRLVRDRRMNSARAA